MKNKKAVGEQIMVFVFFFIVLIIVLGITAGIYIFFGSEYEFKKVDADILALGISQCIKNNQIDFSQDEEQLREEFYNNCRFNKEVIEEYFVYQISINDEPKLSLKASQTDCALGEKSEKYPRCTSVNFSHNSQKFIILAGSQQSARKIPT